MAIACNTAILAHFVKNCEAQAPTRFWGCGKFNADPRWILLAHNLKNSKFCFKVL
jgi:hypothetical protein